MKKALKHISALIVYMKEHELMDHLFDDLFIVGLPISPSDGAVRMVFSCNALILVKKRDVPAGKLPVFEHWCKFKMLQHTNPPLPVAFIIKAGNRIDKEEKEMSDEIEYLPYINFYGVHRCTDRWRDQSYCH